MKKAALVVDYILFIVLFALMFIRSTGTLETVKYLLLLLTAYFLFKTTMKSKKMKATHKYNFLFMSATIVYVLYGAWYSGPLFENITLYFFVASIIGFALALAYKEKVKKIRPPKKPAPNKKTTAVKKVAKKTTTKKVAKKAPAKKKVAKRASKKKVTKKAPAKKKATKKKTAKKASKITKRPKKVTKKKTAKRGRPKVAKKTSKKAKPKVAKKVTTTYYKN